MQLRYYTAGLLFIQGCHGGGGQDWGQSGLQMVDIEGFEVEFKEAEVVVNESELGPSSSWSIFRGRVGVPLQCPPTLPSSSCGRSCHLAAIIACISRHRHNFKHHDEQTHLQQQLLKLDLDLNNIYPAPGPYSSCPQSVSHLPSNSRSGPGLLGPEYYPPPWPEIFVLIANSAEVYSGMTEDPHGRIKNPKHMLYFTHIFFTNHILNTVAIDQNGKEKGKCQLGTTQKMTIAGQQARMRWFSWQTSVTECSHYNTTWMVYFTIHWWSHAPHDGWRNANSPATTTSMTQLAQPQEQHKHHTPEDCDCSDDPNDQRPMTVTATTTAIAAAVVVAR
ncbi:hypothetical protein EI94DRAFT_1698509 [Lactarius quietus]|nr:hypothetical protein EI94DRAFT_1698509 [Lactarius quietus]